MKVFALASAMRDPRVPFTAKIVVFLTLAYAVSPIDLIPDFIPVLGMLDDAVLVPLGLALAIRLIPPEVWASHQDVTATTIPRSVKLVGLVIVLLLWGLALAWVLRLITSLRSAPPAALLQSPGSPS